MEKRFEILAIDTESTSKGTKLPVWGSLSATDFKKGIDSFFDDFCDIFDGCSNKTGAFYIDEIELRLDISLSGGVRLIGAAEASTAGGITVKLKRREHE